MGHSVSNTLVTQLNSNLQTIISDAQVVASPLPELPLQLWLIDHNNMQRQINPEETQRLLDKPPYWSFCWASGLAFAQWILENPEQVHGKRVIDVDAGSGIVALAAKLAGAKTAVSTRCPKRLPRQCEVNP